MAPKDSDTDPSTPSARRPSLRRPTASAFASAEAHADALAAIGMRGEVEGEGEAARAAAEESTGGAPPLETGSSAPPLETGSGAPPLETGSGAPPLEMPSSQTNPGVGPPAPIRSLAPNPVGVVVPSPSGAVPMPTFQAARARPPASRSHAIGATADRRAVRPDSVELLLDGIAGPRPDRSRTTPLTDGQGAANYHAEHDVQRPLSSMAPAIRSVLIDRPLTPRAIPVAAAAALDAARGQVQRSEPTVVDAHVLARRLVLALGGALLVVVVLFVFFLRFAGVAASDKAAVGHPAPSGPSATTAPITNASTLVQTAAPEPAASGGEHRPWAAPFYEPAEATSTPAPSAEATSTPAPSAEATFSPPPSAAAAMRPPGPSLVHRRRRIGGSAAVSSGTGDVGEFKTKF